MSNTFFLLTSSLAFFAASLALAAFSAFCIIVLAILGFCSKKSVRDSDIIESHIPLISPFPSFVFVCPSNCGSGTLIDRIAVNPSLTSSPPNVGDSPFLFFIFFAAYLLRVLVSADLNPAKCVPPSMVFILFTKVKRVSL